MSRSPLRRGGTAAAANLLDEEGGAWEVMGSASASQSAAFAQIDRAILMRRVGAPRAEGAGGSAVVAREGAAGKRASSDTGGVGEEGSVASKGEDTETETETETEQEEPEAEKMVSVSHVLTNIILLQEFILEVAALVQVRAGMFGEVKFM